MGLRRSFCTPCAPAVLNRWQTDAGTVSAVAEDKARTGFTVRIPLNTALCTTQRNDLHKAQTRFIQQSRSGPVGQMTHTLLCNLNVHHRAHNSPSFTPSLCQMKTVLNSDIIFKIRSNRHILPSMLRSSRWSLPFTSSDLVSVCTSHRCLACYILRPSYSDNKKFGWASWYESIRLRSSHPFWDKIYSLVLVSRH